MQVNDDYILLLSKQFSGDITPAEYAMLNEWLGQTPENEQLAAELRQVWEKTSGYSKVFSPDLNAAYQRVQLRIRATEQPRPKIVPINGRLVRIAAAFVVLLAAVWAYREFSTPPVLVKTYVSNNEDKRLIHLPDGSRVWLRREGTLEYPSEFTGRERRVSLTGEAYFEVEHQPSNPFRVSLDNGGTVEVLGTQFNVRQTEEESSVLVRSGKVRYYPDENGGSYVLTDKGKAVFNKSNGETKEEKVLSFNELAWQTGGLEFVKTPLSQVVRDLEQYYHVKITLRNPAMQTCPYSSPITTQPLDKVLESLALTCQFRVTTPEPGAYELSGGNCQ